MPEATLTWTASSSGAVAGYRVKWGTIKGQWPNIIDAKGALTLDVSGLPNVALYFVVTAYTASAESVPSNEAVLPPAPPLVPNPPTNLRATRLTLAVPKAPDADKATRYKLYELRDGGPVVVSVSKSQEFGTIGWREGVRRFYATVVNKFGESAPSKILQLTQP